MKILKRIGRGIKNFLLGKKVDAKPIISSNLTPEEQKFNDVKLEYMKTNLMDENGKLKDIRLPDASEVVTKQYGNEQTYLNKLLDSRSVNDLGDTADFYKNVMNKGLGASATDAPGFNTGQSYLNSVMGSKFDPTLATSTAKATVFDPMMKKYYEEVLPGIRERFASAGMTNSSELPAAEARSTADILGQIMSKSADIAYNSERDFSNRQLQAADVNRGYNSFFGDMANASSDRQMHAAGSMPTIASLTDTLLSNKAAHAGNYADRLKAREDEVWRRKNLATGNENYNILQALLNNSRTSTAGFTPAYQTGGALPLVTAGIGAYFGGPLGASLGHNIGQTISTNAR